MSLSNFASKKKITKRRKRVKGSLVSVRPHAPLNISNFFGSTGNSVTDKSGNLNVNVNRQEKNKILSESNQRKRKLPELEIVNVNINIFSYEDLIKEAVFEVKKEGDTGLNTINDPRTGVVNEKDLCSTCTYDNLQCPGHLGVLKMAHHFLHPLFESTVINVLMSICNSCGGLLLSDDLIKELGLNKLTGSKRLKAIAEASKKLHCRKKPEKDIGENVYACVNNPTYITSKVKELGKIFYSNDGTKGKDNEKTVDQIELILNAISQKDAKLMGFNNKSHPKNFIVKAIPIIPLCSRSPVYQDGELSNDDITTMYLDIVKHNFAIKKLKILQMDTNISAKDNNNVEILLTKNIDNLLYSLKHMINNSDKKYKQGQTKSYLGLTERIQGKEGIIRLGIQGKRVDFSARTVLGPEPNIKFGEIRLPRRWAPILTTGIVVSPQNIGKLNNMYKNDHITHITPANGLLEGIRIKVNDKIKKMHTLYYGDLVERWLEDGDRVVFNRQPTLHCFGIQGYKVVLKTPMTIGLHLSATESHNADFDGDEGTVHQPQSFKVMSEVENIMSIKNCILNPQNNKNIVGVVFDSLVGAYLMTQKETFISIGDFQNIASFIENGSTIHTLNDRLKKHSVPPTSGRALFSVTLPEDFYYRKNKVLILDGVLVTGVITKDHIGATHGSIIQVMMKDYGQDITSDFITDIYSITGKWLDVRGFSVGLGDCFLVGDDADTAIQHEIQKAKLLVKSMGWKLDDPLEEERRENQIMAYLNTASGLGARISDKNLAPDNSFNVMALSGAKGSLVNISAITGMVGQQFVQGMRMPDVTTGGTRCLPYFPENSIDPEARGLCTRSFLTGLNPSELFFHQAGSREGLTDTAVKTSDTGSMHHSIVKALEDVKVYEDGSVRNAFGFIYQYIYGDDGFTSGLLELTETKTGTFSTFINMDRITEKINHKYGYTNVKYPEIVLATPTELKYH